MGSWVKILISLSCEPRDSTISFRCASLEWIDSEGKNTFPSKPKHRSSLDFSDEMFSRWMLFWLWRRREHRVSVRELFDDADDASERGALRHRHPRVVRWTRAYILPIAFRRFARRVMSDDGEVWQRWFSRARKVMEKSVRREESRFFLSLASWWNFPDANVSVTMFQGHRAPNFSLLFCARYHRAEYLLCPQLS